MKLSLKQKSLKLWYNIQVFRSDKDYCPLWLYFCSRTFAKEQPLRFKITE